MKSVSERTERRESLIGVASGVGRVSEVNGGIGGRRVIVTLYVVVIGIAGGMGAAIGSIGLRDLEAVTFLGLVTFQPTPVGLAAFGMLTIGTLLTVILGLVVVVSRRYPEA